MLMAAHKLKNLRYEHVALISDSKQLIDELNQHQAEETIRVTRTTEASSMVRDIQIMARTCNFTFHHIPRSLINSVDVLAKNARHNAQQYVISWLF